jgi:hypothetical protein
MTNLIKLSQGKFALADDEDYTYLSMVKWYYHNGYAVRTHRSGKKQESLKMHRVILDVVAGEQVDHINGNSLDNRRCNLRVATQSQNNKNASKRKDNTSGFKGVSYHKKCKQWVAYINCDGKRTYLGLFASKETAAKAYNNKAIDLHKEYAKLNEETL